MSIGPNFPATTIPSGLNRPSAARQPYNSQPSQPIATGVDQVQFGVEWDSEHAKEAIGHADAIERMIAKVAAKDPKLAAEMTEEVTRLTDQHDEHVSKGNLGPNYEPNK